MDHRSTEDFLKFKTNNTDCLELEQSDLLIDIFHTKNEHQLNRTFKCFYKKFYGRFIQITNRFFERYQFLKGEPEYFGSQAFNDGLLSFYDQVGANGFVEKEAKMETYFLSFCINKLRALITQEERLSKKKSELLIVIKDDFLFDPAINDIYGEQEALFLKALYKMDERKRQYIVLRKIENMKDEQIAERMGIASVSVPNEVYKSFNELKRIIKTL